MSTHGGCEEGVKWLGHYSSGQSILIVGDGDFSFSLTLATAFGSGANLVATSLDSYVALTIKYSKPNIMALKSLEATVLHGVDVKKMELHIDLRNIRFDRIVFNFPHAGFKGPQNQLRVINSHKALLAGFFSNAHFLLRRHGEIHVSHKTGHPYDMWDLEQLASEFSLVLVEQVVFHKEYYPGYNNKRGDGIKCDEPFHLDPCCTFKFQISELRSKSGCTRSTRKRMNQILFDLYKLHICYIC